MPSVGARTIVIGDVHGCLAELQDLLRATAADRFADDIVLVGDLVAKGAGFAGRRSGLSRGRVSGGAREP